METKARLRYARLSPQKARLVADQIRGLPVDKAISILQFSTQKAAGVMRKVLESAMANAENNEGADIDELWVSGIQVDQGPSYKRLRARARGRAARIVRRTSHITVKVSDS